jgi:flagellar protein FliS
MGSSAHDIYLETRVLTADPLELVRILYRLAITKVGEAQIFLASGDTMARGKAISKASKALAELSCSLNHDIGGALSQRLAQLYDYMQWRLVESNFQQTAEPLQEVLGLLSTLEEAWQSINPALPAAASVPVPDSAAYGDSNAQEPEVVAAGGSWTA